jgi:hypothetical protein
MSLGKKAGVTVWTLLRVIVGSFGSGWIDELGWA